MRSRIKQTIALISDYSEISSLVIKGNPFKKRVLKPGASGTSQRTVSSFGRVSNPSPGIAGNTLPQITKNVEGSPRDSSVENQRGS